MRLLAKFICIGILAGPIWLQPGTAYADKTRTLLKRSGDWAAYTQLKDKTKICYVLSQAKTNSPRNANIRHGKNYFLIASWQSGAAMEQPSFVADYPLKPQSVPVVRIGNKQFKMFVSNNEGFIEDSLDEKKLVSAMRAGATMRVQAVSKRGTAVSYGFSLKGVTTALKEAKAACGK